MKRQCPPQCRTRSLFKNCGFKTQSLFTEWAAARTSVAKEKDHGFF